MTHADRDHAARSEAPDQAALPDGGAGQPDLRLVAREAREASHAVAALDGGVRNRVLLALADRLLVEQGAILAANALDLEQARDSGLTGPKLARLALTPAGLAQMADGLRQVAALPDPVNRVTSERELPSGLRVSRVRTPLGVVCMIYESRPGVTVDAFALCFKAGNACILKGGREANRSNAALAELVRIVLKAEGVPVGAIQQVTTSDREQLRELLACRESIDLVIPRGGETLIRFVAENSSIPTVQHYHGVCHVYVDAAASVEKAARIALNAKASAPATCNAAECLLVHASAAPAFFAAFGQAAREAGIELRGDERVRALLPWAVAAVEGDWGTEFLELIYAARVVDSMDEAIEHIHRYASDHTETIVTEDASAAEEFCRRVRSSCVLVNASTRFNDGYQLGLGAEIGISTSRLHAYGPMGVEELTIERWVVRGDGQVR